MTEELYSHIFADQYAKTGSLHARSQWPDAAAYPKDTMAISAGSIAKQALEYVRRTKSESNKSIKFPVDLLIVSPGEVPTDHLLSLAEDLKGAGNIRKLEWDVTAIAQRITLAAEADAA